MVNVKSSVPGFFPRPPYLREKLKETGGLQKEDMGKETKEEITEVIGKARKEIIDLQMDAGIDYCVEGQFYWDDLLVYPATKIKGFKMNGLIRYFNTNRFYRTPIIENKLVKGNDFILEDTKKAIELCDNKIKPIIPGPFTLFELSENNYYKDNFKAIKDISIILKDSINHLNDLNVDLIQIDDPSLTKVSDGVKKIYKNLLENSSSNILVNTYFGDLSSNFKQIKEVADGVGMDITNSESNLKMLKEFGSSDILQLGIFDSTNTKIEDKNDVKKKINGILSYTDPDELLISANLNYDFLPWPIMKKKIEKLGVIGEEI